MPYRAGDRVVSKGGVVLPEDFRSFLENPYRGENDFGHSVGRETYGFDLDVVDMLEFHGGIARQDEGAVFGDRPVRLEELAGLSSEILTSRNQMPLDEGTDSQPCSICDLPRIRAL